METKQILLIILAIMLTASIGNGQPAFTFNIPVDMQSLDKDVDKVMVVVYLYLKQVDGIVGNYDTPSPSPDRKTVAEATTILAVDASGNVNRNVTLRMNPPNPERITHYICRIYLHNKKTRKWLKPISQSVRGEQWRKYSEGTVLWGANIAQQ